MKSIALSVFIYPIPENKSPAELEEHDRRLLEGLRKGWGPFADRIQTLGFDARRIDWLEESTRRGEIRYVTQTILRQFGSDGEVFVDRERDHQFLWERALFEGYGIVHILHVHKNSEGLIAVYPGPDVMLEGPCPLCPPETEEH
jgi:hypothetical protein